MLTHLHTFLRAYLTSQNVGDNKTYVGNNKLAAAPIMAARRWAKEKLSKCFPALTQQTASALTVGNLPQGAYLLALITAIKGTNTTTPKNPSPIKTSDKQDESKWMPKSELDTTLQMCSKASMGDRVDLPAWMQERDKKGTRKHYK